MSVEIKANGKDTVLKEEVLVRDLLSLLQVEMPEYVTVQINEEIIARADFDKIPVKDGDVVEFLYYMGGGSCVLGGAR